MSREQSADTPSQPQAHGSQRVRASLSNEARLQLKYGNDHNDQGTDDGADDDLTIHWKSWAVPLASGALARCEKRRASEGRTQGN